MSFHHKFCGGQHDRAIEARRCEENGTKTLGSSQPSYKGKRPATPDQLSYIKGLLKRRNVPQAYADAVQKYLDEEKFSFGGASSTIDKLKEFPERHDFRTPKQEVTTQKDLREGIYRNPSTGEWWAVRHPINREDGPLYASILIIREQPVLGPDKEILEPAKIGFEYVKGAIRTLHPSWRLTAEQAKEFGDLYGACIKCGSQLSKEESIARGMGDTCYGRQFG